MVRFENKKGRLNIISHLLVHISYEKLPTDPVTLPKRKVDTLLPVLLLPEIF